MIPYVEYNEPTFIPAVENYHRFWDRDYHKANIDKFYLKKINSRTEHAS